MVWVRLPVERVLRQHLLPMLRGAVELLQQLLLEALFSLLVPSCRRPLR
jgi:hypothetical protein